MCVPIVQVSVQLSASSGQSTPKAPDGEGVKDQPRQARARRYASLQRRLFLAEIAVGILYLLLLQGSGVSLRLRQMLALPLPAAAALLFTLVMAGSSLLSFPIAYYRGLALPRYYRLSQETFRGWLATAAKEASLGWVLGIAVTVAIYLLLSALVDWWWLAATALIGILSAGLSFLAPWFLLPMFFKQEPLPQGELSQRLEALARRAGFQPRGIFTIDWSHKGNTANAMFLGMGRSRRIVITDTLLQQYALEEVETIVAHELGHYRHAHVFQLLAFQTGLAMVIFGLTHLVLKMASGLERPWGLEGLADLGGLPLLLLALLAFSLALAPILLAFSRYLEGRADAYCLRLTHNPQAFATALVRLHDQNLAEAAPSRWVEVLFYDHPSLARRLAQARQFQAVSEAKG